LAESPFGVFVPVRPKLSANRKPEKSELGAELRYKSGGPLVGKVFANAACCFLNELDRTTQR